MRLSKLQLFLNRYPWVNFSSAQELKDFIIRNDIKFNRECCGGVEFSTSKEGKRYLIPSKLSKTYID